MKRKQTLRVLDANFNRSREGLRVCEEIARFFLEDEALTERFKKIRHEITDCLKAMAFRELIASRDSQNDVGSKPSRLEKKRGGLWDLFWANAERVKESLRVLEEFSKLVDGEVSDRFKKIRFDFYTVEARALPLLESLCENGFAPLKAPAARKSNSGRRLRRFHRTGV